MIELLAPAGDLEKLKIAIEYGADAVYFAGESFGLRAAAKNFSIDNIREGVEYAHERGKRAYLTLNIFAHNEDINNLKEYLERIKDIPIDAFIVSDVGVMMCLKEVIPNSQIHLSTQANTTNYKTAEFWYNQGVKRIVIARELSFEEIKELKKNLPEDMEIEAFIHGAMCISYSGRCLLSNFLTERDANRGACTHPCRWEYSLVESQRPEEHFPVEEDQRGTYIMNSRDLCMIDYIPEMIESGLASAKIEGRMKSIFYVATIVGTYRQAIDKYYEIKKIHCNLNDLNLDEIKGSYNNKLWLTELQKVSHREFTTGFYFQKAGIESQNYGSSSYTREYDFLGIVRDYDESTGFATVEQRNKINLGDEVEIFGPATPFFVQNIEIMLNKEGESIDNAPHAQQIIKIKMEKPVKENFMIRRKS